MNKKTSQKRSTQNLKVMILRKTLKTVPRQGNKTLAVLVHWEPLDIDREVEGNPEGRLQEPLACTQVRLEV